MKVALFSHNHAELMAGGAERAAYTLFQHLNNVDGCEATLVARVAPGQLGHDGTIGAFRGRRNEILWVTPGTDHFTQSSLHFERMRRDLKEIVSHINPDVVHFHHYTQFGLEALKIIKEELRIPVILTLHEYILICNHNGQMMKTNMRLCRSSSSAECNACYPDISSGKFFLRKKLIEESLKSVDHFISPSYFLKDRYVEWGVDEEKISVIENLLPDTVIEGSKKKQLSTKNFTDKNEKLRIGYFGQINKYKGAPVLLDAILALPVRMRRRVEVVIFGANLGMQEQSFQDEIKSKMKELGSSVVMYGPYDNSDVIELMSSVDWCVIPSIWWENSPIVIQEARAARVPMLASNIGGMKEKILDGKTGVHFLANSPIDLSKKIEDILSCKINVVMPKIPSSEDNIRLRKEHVNIYKKYIEEIN